MAAVAIAAGCTSDPQVAKRQAVAKGDQYAEYGKYLEAIIEYRNAAQLVPQAGDVRVKLADSYLRTQQTGAALREYVTAADLLPGDIVVQLKAGELLLVAGRFDDAKARAERVLTTDPQNARGHLIVANALAGLNDVEGAIDQIEDVIRMNPDRAAPYSNLGALELQRGRKEVAEEAFQRAVALDASSSLAHLALANFYWVTSRWPSAEESLKKAVALSDTALENRALANFYLATNRGREAEAPLKRVVELTRSDSATLMLADYYIASGDDAKASALLGPLVDRSPSRTQAQVRLATIDYRNGQKTEAYDRLSTVLAVDQGNLQALLIKGTLLATDGRLDEALATATSLTERYPESTAGRFLLGRIQTDRQQPQAAIAAYQDVLRLNPRATDAKVALARLSLSQGRPDASVTFAQEALATAPNHGDARLVLVRALLAQGEVDAANVEVQRLLARFPTSAPVHSQAGFVLGRKGQVVEARRAFERARQLEPGSLEALAGLIALELGARNYAAARALIDERISAVDTPPSVFVVAARTYAAGGDPAAAERFLLKAVETDAAHLPAYAALGQLYASQGRLESARQQFETLAARSANSVPALTMIGLLLEAQGKVDEARRQYERIIELDPAAAVAANNLAWMYAQRGGNLDAALQLAQTAQRRLPDVPEVNDTLGFIYYKKDFAPLAVSTLRRSVDRDPANPMYQYHLGLAYAQAGDPVRARQHLTRALRIRSNFDGADDARIALAALDGQ